MSIVTPSTVTPMRRSTFGQIVPQQDIVKAVTKKNHRPRQSVFAPPPDGSWAGAAPVKGGDPSDDGINAATTIDEECLSDDDATRGSKFQYTPTGEAAVAVDMAAGAANSDGRYTRGAGLRRRGEGARWDSAALGTGGRGLPRRYGGANAIARDSHVWTPLTNAAEMEYYRFAVAADPGECMFAAGYATGYRWCIVQSVRHVMVQGRPLPSTYPLFYYYIRTCCKRAF